MRAVIYCRISLDASGEGLGVARQEDACRELCERRGWEVVEVIEDNSVSASTGKARPGWSRVLAMIEGREVDIVVAWQVDRMYRAMRDLEDLVDLSESSGVTFATVTGEIDLSTANGRMLARILGSTARGEVEMKAERQRRAHVQRARAGRPWWNSRPFGFERNGVHRESEATHLQRAYGEVLTGTSVYAIAQRWNREGILTPNGNPWRSSNLRHVLMQPRNAGIATYLGDPTGTEASWEPIVEETIWRAVVRIFDDPARNSGGGGRRKALLTGVAECGRCGGKMLQGQSRPNRAGERYRTYVCRKGRCVTIPADFVDSLVMRRVIDHAAEWVHMLDAPAEQDNAEVASLRSKELTLQAQRRSLQDAYDDDLMDEGAFLSSRGRVDARLADIADRLAEIATEGVAVDPADLEYLWETLDEAMEDDLDRVRSIITSVTQSIRCLPRQRGARRPTSGDIDLTFRRPVGAVQVQS